MSKGTYLESMQMHRVYLMISNTNTVLPLIIPAGIINFLPFFLRELLEVLEIYLLVTPQKMHN